MTLVLLIAAAIVVLNVLVLLWALVLDQRVERHCDPAKTAGGVAGKWHTTSCAGWYCDDGQRWRSYDGRELPHTTIIDAEAEGTET